MSDLPIYAGGGGVVNTPSSRSGPMSNLDLLQWNDTAPRNTGTTRVSATNDSSAFRNASDERHIPQNTPGRTQVRTQQPAGGVSTISLATNLSPDDSDMYQRRRAGSDSKRREMTGSGIFDYEKDFRSPPPTQKIPAPEMISTPIPSPNTACYGEDLSPKKTQSISEAAKQRELSGSFFDGNGGNGSVRRPCSSAKSKEMEGSNIFGKNASLGRVSKPHPSDLSWNSNILGPDFPEDDAPKARTSVKISNPAGGRSQITFGCDGGNTYVSPNRKSVNNQKVAELSGSKIFEDGNNNKTNMKSENNVSAAGERVVSAAKRREMQGNGIFSGRTSAPLEINSRSERQPPGGRSQLKLV